MDQSPKSKFSRRGLEANRNGRGAQGKAASRSRTDDADARYAAALKLVQAIDHNLRNGTQHYYDTQGRLLRSLDEVIHAVLTDSLSVGKPAEQPQDAEAVEWLPASQLVA